MFDGPGGSDRAELFALIGKFESRDNDHVTYDWITVCPTDGLKKWWPEYEPKFW